MPDADLTVERGTEVSGFAENHYEGTCDGVTRPWTLVIVPEAGTYKTGGVATTWFALGCIDQGDYCSGHVAEVMLQIVAA